MGRLIVRDRKLTVPARDIRIKGCGGNKVNQWGVVHPTPHRAMNLPRARTRFHCIPRKHSWR